LGQQTEIGQNTQKQTVKFSGYDSANTV